MRRSALARELLRGAPRETVRDRIQGYLFEQQRRFVEDPARFKTLLCSRRSGKTITLAVDLLRSAELHPGSLNLYIGLQKPQIREMMWEPMKRIAAAVGVQFRKVDDHQLIARLPNGSKLIAQTAEEAPDIEKMRGPKYKKVAIDEAGSFRAHIRKLVEDVLEPALLDQKGDLTMAGTPSIYLTGIFYDATTDAARGWSRHHWTLVQNPHIPDGAEQVEDLRRRRGWAPDHPVFRREYLGEWAADTATAVYRFSDAKNLCDILPAPVGSRSWVIGVDLGWEDTTTFVQTCHDAESPSLWVAEAEEHGHWTITQTANRLREILTARPGARVVMDCSALGKTISEEIKRVHGIPVTAAEKTDKFSHVEMLNADLEGGNVKLVRGTCAKLAEEMKLLQRKLDPQTGNPLPAEDDRCKNNMADALLYAHRFSRPYLGRKKPAPEKWTPEREAQQMERVRESEIRDREQDGDLGPQTTFAILSRFRAEEQGENL